MVTLAKKLEDLESECLKEQHKHMTDHPSHLDFETLLATELLKSSASYWGHIATFLTAATVAGATATIYQMHREGYFDFVNDYFCR